MSTGKYEKQIKREPIEFEKIPGINLASVHLNKDWGEQKFRMGWFCVNKPMLMVPEAHAHDFDQIVCFIGGDSTNMKDFGAEVEFYLGEEGEKYIINTTSIVYIPKGLVHGPLNFVRVDKPILFNDMFFAEAYSQIKKK